ncbi:MAG: DMT family transporter [Candidatus Melainabacteria bacterium]|nr:DMT family transporter [Candidatus Melainabacteria bacterium]
MALFMVSVIFGVLFIVTKLILRNMDALEVGILRILLTAILAGLLELLVFRTKVDFRRDALPMLFISVIGIVWVQIFSLFGIHRTTAFHATLIMATVPVFTLLFGMLLRQEIFSWKKLSGILLAFGGIAYLVLSGNAAGVPLPASAWLGDLIVLSNAIAFAAFLVLSQPLTKKYFYGSVMSYSYLTAAIVSLAFISVGSVFYPNTLSFSALWKTIQLMNLTDWCLMSYMAVLAGIVTYTLNNFALARTQPSTVSAYMFLQPLIAAFLASLVLGEALHPNMFWVTLVTATGVILANQPNKNRRKLVSAGGSMEPSRAWE